MAAFLANPETRGPLTVSIEGEWGSGKSSFMKQLEKALPDAAKAHAAEPPIIVWFNAWRHDKAEELWAAFALELLREFSEGLPLRERWSNHFRLLKLRFDWRHGWRDGLRFIASFVVPAVAALALPLVVGVDKLTTWIGQGPMEGLAGIGYVGFVVALFLSLRNFNGNPFSIDLRKHIRDLRKHIRRPDYNARVSFIEQFHKDFKKILDAYVRDRRVVCFIDDLDRCEVPRAAELMQALNLMLSDDSRMIFLLGMDRRKIAAGLAVKFKDLIPFLSEADGAGGTAAGSSPAKPDGGAGLRFGHDFIEKFVQISYSLPRTAEGNLDAFLKGLAPAPPKPKETGEPEKASRSIRPPQWARRLANKLRGKSAQQDGAETNAPARAEAGKDAVEGPSDERGDEGSEERRKRLVRIVEVEKGGEDPAFTHELVRLVAPAFDYNPRRLKQFINLFRLNVATAGATQVLFAEEETTNLGIGLEQVGKFVALRMRWPEVVEELERRPEEFAAICQWAEGNEEWKFPFRLNRAELLRSLLRAGCQDENTKTKWGLHGVDVRRLLEVSPAAPADQPPPLDKRKPPVTPSEADGLQYALIPAGSFQMGAVPKDDEAGEDEKPRHQVEITKSFELTTTAITVGQYKRFAEATGRGMPNAPEFNSDWEKDDHPIVNVTWEDAQAYCEWAGGRLPTEAEWEYAARGGHDGLKYPNGNELTEDAAHFDTKGTCPLGQFTANGYGLLDMAGNVWEWCSDWYDKSYYRSSPGEDP